MYRITKIINFSYGHRLLNYSGKCCNLHGHNGKVEIEIFSEKLNDVGMVVDFVEIKNKIQKWIDDNLDHKMLLSKDDPMVKILKDNNEDVYVMDTNPTAEAIAKLIYDFVVSEKLPVKKVKLWETETSFAVYNEKRK